MPSTSVIFLNVSMVEFEVASASILAIVQKAKFAFFDKTSSKYRACFGISLCSRRSWIFGLPYAYSFTMIVSKDIKPLSSIVSI